MYVEGSRGFLKKGSEWLPFGVADGQTVNRHGHRTKQKQLQILVNRS